MGYAGFGLLWRLLSKWLVELRTRISEEGESREAGRDVVTSGRQRSLIAKDRRNQIPNMSLVICLGSFLDAKPSHPALTIFSVPNAFLQHFPSFSQLTVMESFDNLPHKAYILKFLSISTFFTSYKVCVQSQF